MIIRIIHSRNPSGYKSLPPEDRYTLKVIATGYGVFYTTVEFKNGEMVDYKYKKHHRHSETGIPFYKEFASDRGIKFTKWNEVTIKEFEELVTEEIKDLIYKELEKIIKE